LEVLLQHPLALGLHPLMDFWVCRWELNPMQLVVKTQSMVGWVTLMMIAPMLACLLRN
jgi:hypothetical protein